MRWDTGVLRAAGGVLCRGRVILRDVRGIFPKNPAHHDLHERHSPDKKPGQLPDAVFLLLLQSRLGFCIMHGVLQRKHFIVRTIQV
jgi:hypothetical protein